ncbi:MAG: toll/interleukin-1 receptor domain-containing protein [Anaerolineae bacterium]|nr:toll/interleukin-1 receptor domain-containing protein [Anaerolineae bacterium]
MPRIFISYRRADTAGYAGRLYDHLRQHFDQADIFMDIDTIPPGADFVQEIERSLMAVDVVLVLIGPQWLTVADEDGQRRIDDPHDFVRLEVKTALERAEMRVIPVLVNDARMPSAVDLPGDLQPLVRRNAVTLDNARFGYDVERLVRALQRPVTSTPAQPAPSGAAPVSAELEESEPVGVFSIPTTEISESSELSDMKLSPLAVALQERHLRIWLTVIALGAFWLVYSVYANWHELDTGIGPVAAVSITALFAIPLIGTILGFFFPVERRHAFLIMFVVEEIYVVVGSLPSFQEEFPELILSLVLFAIGSGLVSAMTAMPAVFMCWFRTQSTDHNQLV